MAPISIFCSSKFHISRVKRNSIQKATENLTTNDNFVIFSNSFLFSFQGTVKIMKSTKLEVENEEEFKISHTKAINTLEWKENSKDEN